MGQQKYKQIKRVLRQPFEFLGVLLGVLLFVFLSRRMLLFVCDAISNVLFHFDRKGRAHANKNLDIIFGDALSSKAREKIIRRSYRNMSRTMGYSFWSSRKTRRRVIEAGEVSEEVFNFLKENNPAVTVSGHIGCWEILSQLAVVNGHKIVSVAKRVKGAKLITKILVATRECIGQEVVLASGAFRALFSGLRSGKSLGLLIDQPVSKERGGIWIRFFGQPVPFSAAPAFFSARCKVPVIVAWSRPLKDGRWRCEKIATYEPSDAQDPWAFTQQCARDLEKIIRRHPSCWVLNYDEFSRFPTEQELAELTAREST